ncbi:MAG: response regulator [Pseudomonadales bacterium]|nr:response regulator [Pseudomonadales bacterium]
MGSDLPKGQQQRILVVEDDEHIRYLTHHILKDLNYEVLVADDGPTALKLLAELDERGEQVDLVFSDVVMPSGMNGIDLSIAVWGRYPDTPVMLTSGFPDAVLREAGMSEEDLRQITVIKKPYSRSDLATSIQDILSGVTRKYLH